MNYSNENTFWLCNPVESCTPWAFGICFQTILVDPKIPAFQALDTAPSKQVACTVGFYLLLSMEAQSDVVFFFPAPIQTWCDVISS